MNISDNSKYYFESFEPITSKVTELVTGKSTELSTPSTVSTARVALAVFSCLFVLPPIAAGIAFLLAKCFQSKTLPEDLSSVEKETQKVFQSTVDPYKESTGAFQLKDTHIERRESEDKDSFKERVISELRKEFGGSMSHVKDISSWDSKEAYELVGSFDQSTLPGDFRVAFREEPSGEKAIIIALRSSKNRFPMTIRLDLDNEAVAKIKTLVNIARDKNVIFVKTDSVEESDKNSGKILVTCAGDFLSIKGNAGSSREERLQYDNTTAQEFSDAIARARKENEALRGTTERNGEVLEQEIGHVSSKEERIVQFREKYKSIKAKKSLTHGESSYTPPERRCCGFGRGESEVTIQRAKEAVFITDQEIVAKHAMKFLSDSPFIKEDSPKTKKFIDNLQNEDAWKSILTSTEKQDKAIAITESGKHVILQQTVKSCVPTCMAMLILDHGKTPDYEAISSTYLAKIEQAIEWGKKAGLKCQKTVIPTENSIELLSKRLAENGPGMLEVDHPTLRGHAIILDAIEDGHAVIRDPFHGWMVTIGVETLKTWLRPGENFLQIA
jgi:hypothetical protein